MEAVKRLNTIRARLNLITLLPLVSLVVLGTVVLTTFSRNLLASDIYRSQQLTLRLEEAFIEGWFSERSQDLAFLAALSDVRALEEDATLSAFNDFLESQDEFYAAVLADTNGITRFDTGGPGGIDISDREYFQQALRGQPAVSDVITGRATGNRIIIFAHPVRAGSQQDEIIAVIFAPVLIQTIDEIMNQVDLVASGESYILNEDGTMLTRSRYEPRLRAEGRLEARSSALNLQIDTEIVRRAREQSEANETYRNYLGDLVLGSYRWIRDNDWLLVYEQPVTTALADFRQLLVLLLVSGIALILIIIPVVRSVAHTIEGPVERLARASSKFLDADSAISLGPLEYKRAPREIRTLSDSLQAMANRVRRSISSLAQSSTSDPLTGTFNRRYLEDDGLKLLKLCARSRIPCAVLMLDLDNFKQVNDNYGHAAGDQALRFVASRIKRATRESDIVVRYGGEEFAVLATNTEESQAHYLAERIRYDVDRHSVEFHDIRIQLTLSVGVSSYDYDEQTDSFPELSDLYRLIGEGDSALYAAKREGRNRVVAYSSIDSQAVGNES